MRDPNDIPARVDDLPPPVRLAYRRRVSEIRHVRIQNGGSRVEVQLNGARTERWDYQPRHRGGAGWTRAS